MPVGSHARKSYTYGYEESSSERRSRLYFKVSSNQCHPQLLLPFFKSPDSNNSHVFIKPVFAWCGAVKIIPLREIEHHDRNRVIRFG